MGVSSSKHNAAPSPSPSTSSVTKRTPSYTSRVLQSSCLRSHDGDDDVEPQVSDHRTEENGSNNKFEKRTNSKSIEVETRRFNKVKVEQPDIDLGQWGQSSLPGIMSREGNASSRVCSSRSFNSTNSFASRCSLLPYNMSFRLSRAHSLGSSGAPCTSTSFAVSNDEGEVHGRPSTSDVSVNEDERVQSCDFFSACFSNRSPTARHQVVSNNTRTQEFSNNWQDDQQIDSTQDNTSPRNHTYNEHFDTRRSNRRIATREPMNRNVRFSRTMSVGRLRERSSFLESAICPFQQEHELGLASQASGRLASGANSEPEENVMISPASTGHPQSFVPGSPYGNNDYEAVMPRARQNRYLDILEQRSNLLERRRRIRSQARALQRIGSRFQHLSGHERSCILSGQHRTGRCTCRANNRENNSNNETTSTGGVSRIVMLAEALFEVLDEIHQQSVVLSSQTSASSIGSVPAPNETVESLPLKSYSRLQKHLKEENDQCYICLLEYEEGDTVRTLPCHHEFHKTCVDKWLKEVHRVCPLCRGDICRPQPLASEH